MTMIQIVKERILRSELERHAADLFGDLVKAVVDVHRGVMAIGGELHSDEEALLLEDGSRQEDLWGINIYPSLEGEEMIEFDSMINVRPRQGNRSRSVESPEIRSGIITLVHRLVEGRES
jgi:hypothetical protein